VFVLTFAVACVGDSGYEQQDEGEDAVNGYETQPQQEDDGDVEVSETPTPEEEPIRLSIVTTTFPQYDWVRQILGDNAENMDITFVINSMVDLHSFNPSVSDIVTISTSDLFIYVGGESDDWIEDALRNADNPDMRVINLMDVLGDALLEFEHDYEHEYEHEHEHGHGHGNEHNHTHTHGHNDDDDDDDEHNHAHTDDHDEHSDDRDDHSHDHHHGEYDEHVWLSLRNAITLSTVIADALIELDPTNAEMYVENLNAFVHELRELDEEFTEMVSESYFDTVVFGDRFPFRYLMEDYGIHYYAAFPGCHAEAEASFSTIIHLVDRVDENELHTILVTESADKSIANTIRSHTSSSDQQILVLDSMQSVTTGNAADGVTFLSIMRSNLDVLREALR